MYSLYGLYKIIDEYFKFKKIELFLLEDSNLKIFKGKNYCLLFNFNKNNERFLKHLLQIPIIQESLSKIKFVIAEL